ncbi:MULTISPECIES: cyclase family protein [unclassified Microbacterium]|uniref:cyclase family protein n=1 Tax=unclassified Microbacterium TaxID=2609290 RepID=UPI000C2CBD01|nr:MULTISPECIES: cyclase family protein [unclassified Microbacterium]
MGPDSRVGAPARFGPENVLRGLKAALTGEVISLDLELDDPHPPFGRPRFERSVRLHNDIRDLGDGRYAVINDDQVTIALQGGSQWDAFAHFGMIDDGPASVYLDGHGLEETYRRPSPSHLGIQALGPAIITRGVLLDLVAVLAPDGVFLPGETRVDRLAVEAAIDAQNVSIHPGDAVLLYTGYQNRRDALGGKHPSDSAGADASTVALWELLDPLALIADNPAFEAVPIDYAVHDAALRRLGIPLGELWALRELALACRADGRYDFLLASVPLRIHGAFGSTANAVAVR